MTTTGALRHEALFYRSAEEFVASTAGFVLAGLSAGEPVLVSVPGEKHELLRTELDDSAARVQLLDMTQVGRNPARIIPAVRRFVEAQDGRRVRFVGEPIWPGRSDAELRECTRHEALLNAAFATAPMTILCPYDAANLAPEVLADATRTHPVLVSGDTTWSSDAYGDPEAIYSGSLHPMPPAPAGAESMVFDDDLAAVRRFVLDVTERAGLPVDVTTDFLVAVNEVATNTLAHTGSGGTVRAWPDPERGTVICEVVDSGHIADPLAGRYTPATGALGGRGLWLVNQFCDLVEIRSAAGGTTIRLHSR